MAIITPLKKIFNWQLASERIKESYKVYTAILSQSGTDAPTATVLENTLGFNITYGRSAVGAYQFYPESSFFVVDKTFCSVTNNTSVTSSSYAGGGIFDSTEGWIITYDNAGAQIDFNVPYGVYLEIRVYN